MARRAAAALIITLLALAAPLRAQPASPGMMMDRMAARLPADPAKVTTADAMQIMDRYGNCLVNMHADLADMVSGPFPDRKRAVRALSEPGIGGCLQPQRSATDVKMSTNFELLRGSVFKARYRQRHGGNQPGFGQQPLDWAPITAGMTADMAKRFVIFHKIAECTLAAAPAPAHQLVLADFGSDAHRAAFAALTPAIGECLPEGLQLELPRPSLAGALAEVAFKKAVPAS